ncbi:acyl-CoA dehydrogenase family protein [Mycolicibacterium nivoides]|uniref:Acyl-CoA dehydrogenase family protein n=1 Tax=Mycolicibacterium nivoides TaxID=2487344 RepID=A0ABW9LLE1_9MYCO
MDFAPNPDHEALRKGVRQVTARFDDDYWAACDRDHRFPDEFYRSLAAGGWLGIAIPEEYGGAGQGITEASLLLQEIAQSGAAMNGCSAIHLTIFGMNPVVKHGSPAERSGWKFALAASRCGPQREYCREHSQPNRSGVAPIKSDLIGVYDFELSAI